MLKVKNKFKTLSSKKRELKNKMNKNNKILLNIMPSHSLQISLILMMEDMP
jgi:hypothetical protein